MRRFLPRLLVAAVSIVLIVAAILHLRQMSDGLIVTHENTGSIPVTVFRGASTTAAPVVVIAHGFAGSQQLMQAFANTLARNGYIAVTFDFPGHGRNTATLTGDLSDPTALQHDLIETIDRVCRYALALPGSDGRLGLIGHSMAADVVARYADAHQNVLGTVAVSLFLPNTQELRPRNLLIVDGALEPQMLRDQAFEIAARTIGRIPQAGVNYGNFSDGSARRVAFSRGVEHIAVLYSADTMREALAWMDEVFNRQADGFLDIRGRWLGLLFLGLIALAWPLSTLLPVVATTPRPATAGWKLLLTIAAMPAVFTPVLLWRMPTTFLPLLLGDYLMLHFALYGALTFALIALFRKQLPQTELTQVNPKAFVLAVVVVTAYSVLAIGSALDHYVISFLPGSQRLPLIAVLLVGTLPYFVADEWLTRRIACVRGGYWITKFFFLLSLVIAVSINLDKLFFLVIIVPAILLLFAIYGLFSAWVQRRTGHPLVAAIANAVVFAWFIAVVFPVVSR